jgi:hypothetical protein
MLQVLVVPGNPGNCHYYTDLMHRIYSVMNGRAHVVAISHAGHDLGPHNTGEQVGVCTFQFSLHPAQKTGTCCYSAILNRRSYGSANRRAFRDMHFSALRVYISPTSVHAGFAVDTDRLVSTPNKNQMPCSHLCCAVMGHLRPNTTQERLYDATSLATRSVGVC